MHRVQASPRLVVLCIAGHGRNSIITAGRARQRVTLPELPLPPQFTRIGLRELLSQLKSLVGDGFDRCSMGASLCGMVLPRLILRKDALRSLESLRAFHFLMSVEASRAARAGYQASRGFARVPIVTRGAAFA